MKARKKTRDGTPSQQEEGARQRQSTRLIIRARVEEAYATLKALVEEEERTRSQAGAEETDRAYKMVEDRYHGTTGGGTGQGRDTDHRFGKQRLVVSGTTAKNSKHWRSKPR